MNTPLGFSRKGQRGQAAVESAIALPMSLFVILGALQMSMMQQARMLADYAAYKGARAASVGRAECPIISRAEVAALVPSLGRADNVDNWTQTFNKYAPSPSYNKDPGTGLPVVYTEFKIENKVTPFDKPLQPNEQPEKIHLRLHYFYQLRIPFADRLIAKYFLAERGLEQWAGTVDAINPTHQTTQPPSRTSGADVVIAHNYYNQGVYVVPLQASWSFRMFSQAAKTQGGCQ